MASDLARVIAGAKPAKKHVHLTAKPNPKAKLGEGGRFAAVEESVAKESGVRDPAAVAAAIGRKAVGAKKMGQLSAQGRKDAKH